MFDRIRHNPLLVVLPTALLFAAGMAKAAWNGVPLLPAAGLLGALAIVLTMALSAASGWFALVGFYLIALGVLTTCIWVVLEAVFGFAGNGSLTLAMVLALVVAAAVAFMRSPFRHRFRGEIEIDVPRAQVWDALHIRPTTNYWKPHMRHIEAVPDRPGYFYKHFRTGSEPDGHGEPPPSLLVKVSGVAEAHTFTVELVDGGSNGLVDRQTYSLEDAGAGTRVRSVEVIENARLDMLVMSALMTPWQDELRQLKAVLEGTPDTTIASTFYRDES